MWRRTNTPFGRLSAFSLFTLLPAPGWAQKCPPVCGVGEVVDTVKVQIDSVTPAQGLIEHSPIDVQFHLTRESASKALPALTGSVCPRHQGTSCVSVSGLTVGATKTGSLRMTAPPAGQASEVEIMFCQPQAPDGVCVERTFGSLPMKVAARYEVLLDYFEILHTRAPTNDSVQVSLAGAAGEKPSNDSEMCSIVGPPTYCVRPVKEGDHRDGLHPVRNDVRVGPFDLVPEVDSDLSALFVVANMGYSYEEAVFTEFMNLMNTFGAGVYGGLGQSGADNLKDGTETLNGLIGRNCDGIVVSDYATFLNSTKAGNWASTLDARTRDRGFWLFSTSVYERPNKAACGDSSKYKIGLRVARTSWRPPAGSAPSTFDLALPRLSDEQGPRYCPSGAAVSAIRCEGTNCDDLQVTCHQYGWDTPLGHRDAGEHRWTGWYSEELYGLPPLTYPNSPPVGFVTGVDCRGSYCDEIRVDLDAAAAPTGDCEQLKPISEETAAARCPAGKFVTQIQCSGQYCDSLMVQCCR